MKIQFEIAGKRKDNEIVFLMSNQRVYKQRATIFHRNDFHTIIKIDNKIFKKLFKYERFSGIYKNMTGIKWEEFKKIADIKTIKL